MRTMRECCLNARSLVFWASKWRLLKKVGPKVVVFDVNNEMTSEELAKEVYAKNLKNAGVSEEQYKNRAI